MTGSPQAQDVARLPEDLRPHWDDLNERYKISQDGHDGELDFLQHGRCDLYGFETWLSRIGFLTKELVAKDLKLVEMMRDHCGRVGRDYGNLDLLRHRLQHRFDALMSIEQAGIPQPMKVLCVLLRELWETRITEGASKLAEEPTSTLQDLCKLIQNAMEDWENVKRCDHWCGKFCRPLWELRASRGRGPPRWWNSDQGFEDFQLIQAEAQRIITGRLAAVADHHPEATTENDTSEVKRELLEMKAANDSLKLEVVKMEEKFKKLEQDTLTCREMCQNHQKAVKELADLKTESLKMQKEVREMKSEKGQLDQKVRQLEQDASKTQEVNEQQQSELQVMKEELGRLQNHNSNMKEELQELKLENESMKLRGLEVDGRVSKLQEDNTFLSKKLDEHVQKLEEERLRMKEELVDFKNDKLKLKEDLMECNSGKLKILVELNGDKLKMKEELQDLKSKYDQLRLKSIQSDISDVCSEVSSWVKVHQDAEASMLHSASSAFSVDTNGPRCFMLDAVFKTPSGAFLSGTDLRLGLIFLIQKLQKNMFFSSSNCSHMFSLFFCFFVFVDLPEHIFAQVQRY